MANNSAYNLGASLGQLVMGNPAAQQDAYLKGQQLGSLVNDRMASASRARAAAMIDEDRATARSGITPQALQDAGYSASMAPLLGSILRANDTVKLGDLGALANPTAGADLSDASAAMRSGDVGLGNRLLIAAQGKPVETTRVADGTAYNPYGDAGQTVNVTPLGDATIGLRKAQAGAANASAANSYAHARTAGAEAGVGKAPSGYRWRPDGGLEPIPGGPADQSPTTMLENPNGAHGDDYLASIDPTSAAQVKALAEGRMAFPTGTALKSPYWQGMLQHVAQYDPSFDAVNYNARSGTRKDFTSGKAAQTVNALNTVAEHLGTFSDDAADLNNTRFPAINSVKNWIAGQTGDPTIARFNTAKKAVADEVAKVWRNSGGSEADIQENLHNLNGAQSPEQLNAAIGTLTQLIHGKIAALQDQYRAGMGTTANPRGLISPEAQSAFDKTLSRAGVNPDAFNQSAGAVLGQTGQNAQGAPAAAPQMARPTTQADFNALPSGALYVDPDDGKTYRKP